MNVAIPAADIHEWKLDAQPEHRQADQSGEW